MKFNGLFLKSMPYKIFLCCPNTISLTVDLFKNKANIVYKFYTKPQTFST